jgi:hypothetical protein
MWSGTVDEMERGRKERGKGSTYVPQSYRKHLQKAPQPREGSTLVGSFVK